MLNARPVHHRYALVRCRCFGDAAFKTSVWGPTYPRITFETRDFLGLHRLESLSIIRFGPKWARVVYKGLTSFLPAIHWAPPTLWFTRNRSFFAPAVHSTDFIYWFLGVFVHERIQK